MKIAMWSGPRNLSTAMMYSFAARNDCAVWDEPFYATYLAQTGLDHPMREAILQAGKQDADVVARLCSGAVPDDKSIFYQKHMTHHMIPEISRDWMLDVVNVFLIRHPARVIASYQAKRQNPALEDLGFVQQVELFEQLNANASAAPIVVDSTDIRQNPEHVLRKLCSKIGLPFQDAMLHWPAGGHKNDGAWAPHWYGSVWKSTGFAGAEGPLPDLSGPGRDLLKQAMPYYERMACFKIGMRD